MENMTLGRTHKTSPMALETMIVASIPSEEESIPLPAHTGGEMRSAPGVGVTLLSATEFEDVVEVISDVVVDDNTTRDSEKDVKVVEGSVTVVIGKKLVSVVGAPSERSEVVGFVEDDASVGGFGVCVTELVEASVPGGINVESPFAVIVGLVLVIHHRPCCRRMGRI